MARGKHGGYRKPSSPAAVSGPGALSQRTDGGPANMEFSGLPYGQNQAVNDQAAAAPTGPPAAGSPGGSAPPPGRPPFNPEGAFGPTTRPNEPMTSGVDFGPGAGAQKPVFGEDPHAMLRVLAQQFPSPDLDRLIARMSRG